MDPAAAPASCAPQAPHAPHAIVPRRLRERVQLVVFDFDLTLLRVHTAAAQIAPEDVARRAWQRDFVDLAFFRQLVTQLHGAGIRVAIASFGHYATIQAYMSAAFPDPPLFDRETIVTPGILPGGRDGVALPDGKQSLLARLQARLFGTGPRAPPRAAVLLVDDDASNIGHARAAGHGVLHVPHGLSAEAWMRGIGDGAGNL